MTQLQADKSPGFSSAVHSELLLDESPESYRDGARVLFRVINFLAVVILILLSVFSFIIKDGYPQDSYFAMFFDGRRVLLEGVSSPSFNPNAVLSWASEASTDIMTFGFNDINERFSHSQSYFTDVGWTSFHEALAKSALLKKIMGNQQIMTAIPTGLPTVLWEGVRDGEYVWDIQVPIVLTIRAGNTMRSAFPNLTVSIIKVPTSQNPTGMGIQQWSLY
jgi:hypothetical protein